MKKQTKADVLRLVAELEGIVREMQAVNVEQAKANEELLHAYNLESKVLQSIIDKQESGFNCLHGQFEEEIKARRHAENAALEWEMLYHAERKKSIKQRIKEYLFTN